MHTEILVKRKRTSGIFSLSTDVLHGSMNTSTQIPRTVRRIPMAKDIRLFNTLGPQLESFVSIEAGKVRL
jgi:hypothetical protein